MDFVQIKQKHGKNNSIEIYPDFKVLRSKDLMVRGKFFYAVWDENVQLWSTDEYDIQRLVDQELLDYKSKISETSNSSVSVKLMSEFSSRSWSQFRNYLSNLSDNSSQLDTQLVFQNTEVKKKDYVSRRLPYSLEEGPIKAYEELMATLYDADERKKLEWAMGAVVAGEAKDIQKFIVMYGEMGTGKSTVLNIIQQLFDGYYITFDSKALTSNNNSFSTEAFRTNPLVAIQHDGDLSRIEDNTKLNSIVSHEQMTVNEKFKSSYTMRINSFLFMATNKPVKITDAKSGIIRRLIDVRPSGLKIPNKKYQTLIGQVGFELGAIASHCLKVYRDMGKNYYSGYKPLDMMMQTDIFYNFVEENFHTFKQQDGISLPQAYDMYKAYCEEALVDFKLPKYKFREELKNYFSEFSDLSRIDGKQKRSVYSGFITDKFTSRSEKVEEAPFALTIDSDRSLLNDVYSDCPAQYSGDDGKPELKWANTKTKLSSIDSSKLHWVKFPPNHIVIDLDLKDNKGEKSAQLNMEAASKFPSTYTEWSQGGKGIHLHYDYEGDPNTIARMFSPGIEIKVFNGDASLRRKFSKSNNVPISKLKSGLPLKGVKVINFDVVKSEKGLRSLITQNLNKEVHPGTKPSIDFIHKILSDAYDSDLIYDLTDIRPKILNFATKSSNQSEYCVKLVSQMKFKSKEVSESKQDPNTKEPIVFFDVEVFPNLFICNWKYSGDENKCVRMINPSPSEIESLMKMKLIGFNCRRYDNHILYARYLGYTNQELFDLSNKIINESKNAFLSEAYNVSYTDVYDFSSSENKKGLKKWEIELGLHHQELGLPWDQPVSEHLWIKVAEYCDNDVISTEKVFYHLSGDWAARRILSKLSGLSVNDTTNQHAIRIIFGRNKTPQDQFVYTKLDTIFPGYVFENGVSTYRGEQTGEGGYVYAEPGMYSNVAVLDVASMHPSSIEALDLFGPYTKRYSEMKRSRVAIKRSEIKLLEDLLEGQLMEFMEMIAHGEFTLKDLSTGLKTVLNSVYGLTSATFDNPCRDPRNIDNIVAKRGALFMIDLKHAVQEKGFKVVHIKTDSIKIPNATQEIIDFVFEFGKKYGYEFEHEVTYSDFCLVNDAVYIAREKGGKKDGKWASVGAQFSHPYVFKKLFSKEKIKFSDLCETKSVTTVIYLDMNEALPDDEHNYVFVGRVGSFCPMTQGSGGGILLREKDQKYYAVGGTKGYRWLEAEVVQELKKENEVDLRYHDSLVDAAITQISKFGNFQTFVQDGLPF